MSFYQNQTAGDTSFRRKFTAPENQISETFVQETLKEKDLVTAREREIGLDNQVNKVQVVDGLSKVPGYYCQVCDITCKEVFGDD